MVTTQQGIRHQSARDGAGTVETYDGDLRALFEATATVPPGSTFNEAFILWLQSVTGSTETNVNDLHALYASLQVDTYNWSSVGTLESGAFSPEDIAGLEWWFDASDASTITESGGSVSNWADKSGNNRDVGAGDPARQPLVSSFGGRDSLLFDGDDSLTGSVAAYAHGESTFFAAIHTTAMDGTRYVYTTTTGLTNYFRRSSAGLMQPHVTADVGNNSNPNFIVGDLPDNTAIGLVVRHQSNGTSDGETTLGATSTDADVGTLQASTSSDLLVGARTTSGGGSAGWIGHIFEIGFYSNRVSDANKQNLLDYMASKWSL